MNCLCFLFTFKNKNTFLHNTKVLINPKQSVLIEILGLLDLRRITQNLMFELLKSDQLPQSASKFVVGQFSGQTQTLVRQLVGSAVSPCEQHSHLKRGYLKLKFPEFCVKIDLFLFVNNKIYLSKNLLFFCFV